MRGKQSEAHKSIKARSLKEQLIKLDFLSKRRNRKMRSTTSFHSFVSNFLTKRRIRFFFLSLSLSPRLSSLSLSLDENMFRKSFFCCCFSSRALALAPRFNPMNNDVFFSLSPSMCGRCGRFVCSKIVKCCRRGGGGNGDGGGGGGGGGGEGKKAAKKNSLSLSQLSSPFVAP